ncbi:hypothetical protein ACU18_13950 [Arthrobacter sp. ZBG10]|uniref:PIN domain-containing protein n=1 Tax=Arthrobacter sp. ZBG10 TaxID=1676590 RepID=UPI00067FF03C|nr:PIN domain-containing protein [Arthrobacter sp. ZBG10]KNH16261.1 hypothetical protein ACU18_13950 [Arthrobacter sp. ZBG10]
MIVIILDTNILHKSPFLSRDEWRSLSTHKDEWKVKIMVPEVVVMETTNTVQREWTRQKNTFSTAKVGEFGLQEHADAIVHAIAARIDSYEDDLKKRLSELGAEVLPDPTISHTKVAERASKGKAPYQGKATKDNYRDTLIWLTVIEAARNNPDDEVWFVSDNHKDFGGLEGEDGDQIPKALHQELQKELASLGLQNQVKYAANLAALVQHISALYGPIATEELDRLTAAVKYDLLEQLLNEQVLTMTIPARDVALEPAASVAAVNEILSPELKWNFSDEAKSGEHEWTANYVVDLEAVVLGYSSDMEEMLTIDNKVLRASGTVSFTTDGNIQKFEVSRLEAHPDDPNHRLWELLDKAGFAERNSLGKYLTDRLQIGLTLPPEIMEAMRRTAQLASGLTLPPETMEAMRKVLEAAAEKEEPDEKIPNAEPSPKS